MTLVPQLERELVAAARRAATATHRSRRMRPSLVALVVIGGLALAAAALAAGGLLGSGAPLKPAGHPRPDPHKGLGVLKPGSAQVLTIAVPDPAGGPPWGLRYVATTRGLGCLQAGRLEHGQLGVLGQDGAFADDGRFHPFAANYLGEASVGPFPCGTLDAHGHAFGAVSIHGGPASGLLTPSSSQRGCVAHRDHGPIGRRPNQPPICPRKDWRLLYYGMAGPEAESVTYSVGGRTHTVPTIGEQGAYLIVLKASPHLRELGEFSLLPGAGGGPIVRVAYRDGRVCRRRPSTWVGKACPPVGQAPIPGPRLTTTDVASPVTARVGKAHYGPDVVVSFTARVAVTDASSSYTVRMRFDAPGVNCHAIVGGGLSGDVRAGQREVFRIPTNGCRGRFHGSVSYVSGLPSTGVSAEPVGHTLRVGTFTVEVR